MEQPRCTDEAPTSDRRDDWIYIPSGEENWSNPQKHNGGGETVGIVEIDGSLELKTRRFGFIAVALITNAVVSTKA